MENTFSYFRIKTEWKTEMTDGSLQKIKTEELVYAANYTDAERVAHEIATYQGRGDFGSYGIEITKTKIGALLYSNLLKQDDQLIAGLVSNFFAEDADTEVGLYSVKVIFIEEDEKSGKEKRTTEIFYTPATSGVNAHDLIKAHIQSYPHLDFLIREVKFDKAESILWPVDIHQEKINQFEARD